MREIEVHEVKKVPQCFSCLYFRGISCGNANVGKAYLAYLYGLRECPLDGHCEFVKCWKREGMQNVLDK